MKELCIFKKSVKNGWTVDIFPYLIHLIAISLHTDNRCVLHKWNPRSFMLIYLFISFPAVWCKELYILYTETYQRCWWHVMRLEEIKEVGMTTDCLWKLKRLIRLHIICESKPTIKQLLILEVLIFVKSWIFFKLLESYIVF